MQNKFRKATFLGAMALCSLTLAAYASEKKLFEAEKLFPFLKNYYSIASAERNAFHLSFFAVTKDGTFPKFKATLKRNGADVPITIGANGEMRPIPTAADLASKTQVELEAEKGTNFGIMIRLIADISPSATIEAKKVELSISQAQKGAQKAAGVMGFAVPRLDSACFVGASSGTLTLSNGQALPLKTIKSKKDRVLIGAPCYTPSKQKSAVSINLDRAPTSVTIQGAPD